MLSELTSSTYEITPGKLPAYVIMGQSNAHPYVFLEMHNMLAAAGTPGLAQHNNHPGQFISYWYTTTPQTGYTEDMAFLDAINSAYEVRAVFWIQGESNAGFSGTANFDTYTINFINAMIAHLGYTPDINICKIWYSGADAGIITDMNTIRGMQDTVAGTFTGRKHDMKYYPKTDFWHLNEFNYRKLGYDLLIEYAKWKTGAY